MTHLYDNVLLAFVFQVYYAHIWLWTPPLVLAVLALPMRRRSGAAVLAVVTVWHVACLALWDLYAIAPVPAWLLAGALAFRWLGALWFLAPDGWFSSWLIRRYLRFDPRCDYLFDLARARRRLPEMRAPEERRAALPAPFGLSAFELGVFRFAAWACEKAIRLCRALPAYWASPQSGERFGRPHVLGLLRAELARVRRGLEDNYEHVTLSEYRRQTPLERSRSDLRSRRFAERAPLLHEAVSECLAFRRPLTKGAHRDRVEAYREALRAWRVRRQHDWLWREPAPSEAPLQPEAPGLLEAAEAVEDAANGFPTPDEERQAPLEAEAAVPDETPGEAEEDVVPYAVDSVVLTEADDPGAPEDEAAPEAEAAEPEAETETVWGVLQKDEPPAEETGEGVAREDEPSAEEAVPDEEAAGPEDLFDVALESSADDAREEAATSGAARPTEAGAGKIEDGRARDVLEACAILEALLELPPPPDLAAALDAVWPPHDRPETWQIAFYLIVMYCSRPDWRGERDDALKLAVIERIWSGLAERLAYVQLEREGIVRRRLRADSKVRQEFEARERAYIHARLAFADLLASRGDCARVRSVLAEAHSLRTVESRMLGEAGAGLAKQIETEEELRDMLRYEAMDWYFRAGYRGLWRRRVASTLIGPLRSQNELIELFNRYPVTIGRPASEGEAAAQ